MSDFKELTIKDFAEVKGGKRLPKGIFVQDEPTNHPYIRVTDFEKDRLCEDNIKYITDDVFEKIKRYIITDKDVYISIAGTIGLVGIIPKHLNNANLTENAAKICNINDLIMKHKYLMYYLRSINGQYEIQSKVVGTSQPKLALYRIEEIKIKTPNIKSQDKIAKVLSNYDDLIENNNKRINILEEMAQKIYKEWFVDFKFPNHETATFKQTELGSEVMPKKGKNITKATIKEGNVPVVAGGIEPAYYHNVPNTVAPVITVSASGANAGYINLYYQDIWASDCSYIDATMTPYVYYYYLLLKYNQIKVTNMQRGAAQPHVYPQDLAQLKIKIPEEKVIGKFNEIITPFFSEISNLSLKNQTLKQTRDRLLPRLISGEIDVENLNIL